MSYRVNLDGTPHTCQFDEDGTCQLHVFTKLIEKPSANPKVEWHDGWVFIDDEIYIAQRVHSAKCAELERLRADRAAILERAEHHRKGEYALIGRLAVRERDSDRLRAALERIAAKICACRAHDVAREALATHVSDCAVHNGPAIPVGPCDCGADQMKDT